MNQPIKTAIPASTKKLLREAISVLPQSLTDHIGASCKDAAGNLDPMAEAMAAHINCLRLTLYGIEDYLENDSLKYLVGNVLHGSLMLNLSFLKMCEAANEARGTQLNNRDANEPWYKYKDEGAILEAIEAAELLNDIIADLRLEI